MSLRNLLFLFCSVTSISLFAKQKVILSGRCLNPKITYVDIQKVPPLCYIDPSFYVTYYSSEKENDQFFISFDLEKPERLRFSARGVTFYFEAVPGDSLSFEINTSESRPTIVFRGKRAGYYNYYAEVAHTFPYVALPNHTKYNDPKAYLDEVLRFIEKRRNILDRFSKKYAFRKSFVESEKKEIFFDAIIYYRAGIRGGLYSEDFLSEYVGFKCPKIESFPISYTHVNAGAFTSLYLRGNDQDIKNVFGKIRTNFAPATRPFLMANLLAAYSHRKTLDVDLLKSIKDYAFLIIKDPSWLNYLERCYANVLYLNKPFPDNVLENTILTSMSSGQDYSLAEVLDKYKANTLYLDFWASWCSPCREDIKHSGGGVDYLKSKNVKILYISVDSNKDAWMMASKQDSITSDQYLLNGSTASALAKYLGVKSIPRYILLDKKHLLNDIDAPRPTESNFNRLKQAISRLNIVKFNEL